MGANIVSIASATFNFPGTHFRWFTWEPRDNYFFFLSFLPFCNELTTQSWYPVWSALKSHAGQRNNPPSVGDEPVDGHYALACSCTNYYTTAPPSNTRPDYRVETLTFKHHQVIKSEGWHWRCVIKSRHHPVLSISLQICISLHHISWKSSFAYPQHFQQ